MTSKVVLCELLGVLCFLFGRSAANVCTIDLYTQLKYGIAGCVVVLRRKLNTSNGSTAAQHTAAARLASCRQQTTTTAAAFERWRANKTVTMADTKTNMMGSKADMISSKFDEVRMSCAQQLGGCGGVTDTFVLGWLLLSPPCALLFITGCTQLYLEGTFSQGATHCSKEHKVCAQP